MQQYELVKEFGEGVDRMFREMAEAGNPAPEYKQVEFMVKVRLTSALREENVEKIVENATQKSTLKSTLKDTLKGTRKDVVEIISNNPNVTIPQIAEQLGMNPRGIDKHLKALREQGIIRRVGPDKGGHWEIIKQY
jgi:ATP-dependent DNA helicase RecG